MRFYALKVTHPTVLQPIHVPPFVNDDGLSATCMARYLIINKKLQVIYTSETVYPQFSRFNF